MILALCPAVSLVSIILQVLTIIRPETTRALAQGRLSLLLALEVAPIGGEGDRRSTWSCAIIRRMSMEIALGRATHPRRTVKLGLEVLRRVERRRSTMVETNGHGQQMSGACMRVATRRHGR